MSSSPWIEIVDATSGRVYYHNRTTNAVTWSAPPDLHVPPSAPPPSLPTNQANNPPPQQYPNQNPPTYASQPPPQQQQMQQRQQQHQQQQQQQQHPNQQQRSQPRFNNNVTVRGPRNNNGGGRNNNNNNINNNHSNNNNNNNHNNNNHNNNNNNNNNRNRRSQMNANNRNADDPRWVSCKIFVGGLSVTIKSNDLHQHFKKYGEIEDAIVMTDRTSGRSRCFGFVTFKRQDSMRPCFQQIPHTLGNMSHPCEIKPADMNGPPKDPYLKKRDSRDVKKSSVKKVPVSANDTQIGNRRRSSSTSTSPLKKKRTRDESEAVAVAVSSASSSASPSSFSASSASSSSTSSTSSTSSSKSLPSSSIAASNKRTKTTQDVAAAAENTNKKQKRSTGITSATTTSTTHLSQHPWMTHLRDVPELQARYSDLGVPFDLARLECSWIFSTHQSPSSSTSSSTSSSKDSKINNNNDATSNQTIPLTKSSHFCMASNNLCMGNDASDDEEEEEEEEEGGNSYYASVLLLSGDPMHGTKDEYCSYMPNRVSIRDRISFLFSNTKQRGVFLPSGAYSKKLDGGNPEYNDQDLIETAIRSTKSLCGLDLSKCTKWIKFCSFVYDDDADGSKMTSVIFIPDIWNIVPTEKEYIQEKQLYMKRWSSNGAGDDALIESVETMKVVDLKKELSIRSLSTKGIKSVLQERMVEVLEKEKKEAAKNALAPPKLPETRCLLVMKPTKSALDMYGDSLGSKTETLSKVLKQNQLVKERSSFETNVVIRMFDEMLQRRFADVIYATLLEKRKLLGSTKITVDRGKGKRYEVLSAIKYFGVLDERSMTRMIHYLGNGLSASLVGELLKEVSGGFDELWK